MSSEPAEASVAEEVESEDVSCSKRLPMFGRNAIARSHHRKGIEFLHVSTVNNNFWHSLPCLLGV